MLGKSEESLEKEIVRLKSRLEKLEREVSKVESLEKSLAYHEIVLIKKVTDMHRFEEKLEKYVNKEMFEELKKDLKKIAKHEELIFENSRYIREIINELSKMKEAQRLAREEAASKSSSGKDFEEQMSELKSEIKNAEKKKNAKSSRQDIDSVKEELHDRLSQLEYQNKLLMKYLKLVDEKLVNRGIIKGK